MATIANQYDPNNPNANANNGGSGTVMPSMGGGDASGGGGGGEGSATPYQPPNVSQYLAANQGAGEQLTQGITSNIQNQANQLGNQQQNASNSLNKQYNDLNANLNTNTANQVAQAAFQNPQQLLDSYNASKANSSNQPLSQPMSAEQQQAANQYNQFQQLNTGGYNQGIQNYGNQGQQYQADLQNQLSGLTQQTGSTQNEMGRNQLLQNAIGQGNYNQGQQTLDSLFLQGSPGQRNAGGLSNLQQLQQNLGNIGNQATQSVKGLGADTQNRLAALQGLAGSDQALIKNLFLNGGQSGAGLNQIANNVQNQYNTAKQNATDVTSGFDQAFTSGQYTPEQLAALGLKSGQQTWGLSGEDIRNAAGYQANPLADFAQGGAAMTASPEEFARYNALNQLAGGPSGLQSSVFGSATQAGGFNPYNLNAGNQGITDAINKQAQLYGVTKVNNFIDQMRNSGYFAGKSEGGGMRAADPQAPYRQAMGAALTNLQNTSTGDNPTADPNAYYQQAIDAINNVWAGTGADPFGWGGALSGLKNYGSTFNEMKNQNINNQPNKGKGTPKGVMG